LRKRKIIQLAQTPKKEGLKRMITSEQLLDVFAAYNPQI